MAIQTVTGRIDSANLGVTLPHEHLLLEPPQSYVSRPSDGDESVRDPPITLQNYRRLLREVFYPRNALTLNEEDVACEELAMFKRAGGSTLVDLTVDGLGRNPVALKRIAMRCHVNIVMGTGFFIESSHPPRVKSRAVERLADEMIHDLKVGPSNTGIRAGIIGEIGISPSEILPNEKKVLQAVAIAYSETKAPINVHTWGDLPEKRTQNKVLDILEREGVKLEKVALSHLEQVKSTSRTYTTDWSYVASLAERGAYVSLDTFGQEWPWGVNWSYQTKNITYMPSPTDFERVKGVMTLLNKGQGKKILLSHDVWHRLRLKRYGGDGYDHLLTNVKKIFAFLGVEESTIRQLMVDNPRSYLT